MGNEKCFELKSFWNAEKGCIPISSFGLYESHLMKGSELSLTLLFSFMLGDGEFLGFKF